MTPCCRFESIWAPEYRKAIRSDAEQGKKVKQNLTKKVPLAGPYQCRADTDTPATMFTHSRILFLATLQIFWEGRSRLHGTGPQHMHRLTTAHTRPVPVPKANFRKLQPLSPPHTFESERETLRFLIYFSKPQRSTPALPGTQLLPLFSWKRPRFTSPSISIRFHFIWIMAEGGNRSGQRLFSYQTLKKSITQKERHLQITVQSIPHKR